MPSRDTGSRSGSSKPSASPSVTPAENPRRRALSMLEALPVEVLEQIFLYSLNLNFARASPALAAAVSSERIYALLILLAGWDDPPSSGHGDSPTINRMLAPLDYVPLTIEDRNRLQEAVFRCNWCTMDRVLKQVPNILILTIHRHWVNAGVEMEPDQKAALDRFLRREDDSVRVFHGKGEPLRKFAEIMGGQAPELLRLSRVPGPHHYELHITPMARVEIRSHEMKSVITFPALNLAKFPDRLVRGGENGFSAEDVYFLEMLRMTSHNFIRRDGRLLPSTLTTVNRTALHQGVTKAIRTQNFNAMMSLLKIDEFCFRFHISNRGRGVYYTIPADHFLTVTRVGRENPHLNQAFFEALIRTSAESLPPNSQEVMAWALENVRLSQRNPSTYNMINGRFARWLSDFMLRLPEQIDYAMNEPGAQLFCCGQLDAFDLEGCRYMEEVVAPIGLPVDNWTEQSMFHLEDHWVKKPNPALPN